MLSRNDHCALAQIDVEVFKSLQRRNQLPTMSGEAKDQRGYSPFESLLLVVANELAQGPSSSRDTAAYHASYGFGPIHQRWRELDETSAKIASGEVTTSEIFFAVIEMPVGGVGYDPTESALGAMKKPLIFCGTLSEMLASHPAPGRVAAINLSRALAGIRVRAKRFKIDISDFLSYRVPGFTK